jgi:transcriptional regulator with XRE-family HTH domain
VVIGERLRALRKGDIEKRTGLLRCYISRVENGYIVPSIDTLEKISRALEVPLYKLLYEGNDVPTPPKVIRQTRLWGRLGKEAHLLKNFCRLFDPAVESRLQNPSIRISAAPA